MPEQNQKMINEAVLDVEKNGEGIAFYHFTSVSSIAQQLYKIITIFVPCKN